MFCRGGLQGCLVVCRAVWRSTGLISALQICPVDCRAVWYVTGLFSVFPSAATRPMPPTRRIPPSPNSVFSPKHWQSLQYILPAVSEVCSHYLSDTQVVYWWSILRSILYRIYDFLNGISSDEHEKGNEPCKDHGLLSWNRTYIRASVTPTIVQGSEFKTPWRSRRGRQRDLVARQQSFCSLCWTWSNHLLNAGNRPHERCHRLASYKEGK